MLWVIFPEFLGQGGRFLLQRVIAAVLSLELFLVAGKIGLVGSKGCLLRFYSFSHVGFKGCQIKTEIGRFGLREILLSLFQKRQGLVALSLRGKNVLLAHLFSQRRGFTNSRIGVYHGIPPRSGFEKRLCRHHRLLDDTDPRIQHIKARASGRHHLRGRLLIVIVAQRRLQRLHGCDRVL